LGVNFSSFEIGRRALRASQLGLTVAGQNIANVNTPGYARQAVQLSATPAPGVNRTGAGVTIDGVRAFRDRFVETRLQTETAATGRYAARRDALAPVDAAFTDADAPGGLQHALGEFFGAFRDLEAHPESVPLRASAVAAGRQLAAAFNTTRARLSDARDAANIFVADTAAEANALSREIAQLNSRVASAEAQGAGASELRDRRGEAVRQLAELTGARAVEAEDGRVTLTLADGRPLVVGDRAFELEAAPAPPDGLNVLLLEGLPAVVSDGRLRGLAEAIAETGALITSLDQLAASIAERVNTLHAGGTDLDGAAGLPFFSVPAGGAPVTAANIGVSAALAADPRLVVASPLAPPATAGTVAGSIANLLTDPGSQAGARTGSFASILSTVVADAGAGVRAADDALQTQQLILAQAQAQRDSVSGVSLDEEAINLLQYQKAFEAAARFLKIADEMTQTILSLGQ
jgi:flagellar hook-associated protein 1